MPMNGAAMQAVNYRLNRPDWNLLEHRATMEIPFLMPGDTTAVVVKITRSGMWMYMCMFPLSYAARHDGDANDTGYDQ